MRKWTGLAAAGAVMLGSGAQAQEWAGMGKLLARFYNEEMSVPKGWELAYSGLKDGVEVYTFTVRPETVDVDTSSLDADLQMRRLMCTDKLTWSWIQAGMKVRANKVVIRGSKQEVTKGTALIRCLVVSMGPSAPPGARSDGPAWRSPTSRHGAAGP
jgi:hypothetical protein